MTIIEAKKKLKDLITAMNDEEIKEALKTHQ
jgi:hypothetical protein